MLADAVAPLAAERPGGGAGLGVDPAMADAARRVLGIIDGASLTIGWLFEEHLNAVKLAVQYGAPPATASVRDEVAAWRISGV